MWCPIVTNFLHLGLDDDIMNMVMMFMFRRGITQSYHDALTNPRALHGLLLVTNIVYRWKDDDMMMVVMFCFSVVVDACAMVKLPFR